MPGPQNQIVEAELRRLLANLNAGGNPAAFGDDIERIILEAKSGFISPRLIALFEILLKVNYTEASKDIADIINSNIESFTENLDFFVGIFNLLKRRSVSQRMQNPPEIFVALINLARRLTEVRPINTDLFNRVFTFLGNGPMLNFAGSNEALNLSNFIASSNEILNLFTFFSGNPEIDPAINSGLLSNLSYLINRWSTYAKKTNPNILEQNPNFVNAALNHLVSVFMSQPINQVYLWQCFEFN